MQSIPSQPIDPRQCLSELLDGEADSAAEQQAVALWAKDPQAQRVWHAYHLIGDVLRSEELATSPARDAAFMSSFRSRLAAEPVVLAPARIEGKSGLARRRAVWIAPVATALGLVAMAGALVLVQSGTATRDSSAPVMAVVDPAGTESTAGSSTQRVVPSPQGQMLRDARVDEYLRAHRATLAGSPAALPGGAMRNVDLIVPQR